MKIIYIADNSKFSKFLRSAIQNSIGKSKAFVVYEGNNLSSVAWQIAMQNGPITIQVLYIAVLYFVFLTQEPKVIYTVRDKTQGLQIATQKLNTKIFPDW